MKVKDLMTQNTIWINPEETAAVAARTMERYNIGSVPVCTANGRLCGMVTDRDLAVRCMASERPASTRVADVMTRQISWVAPETELEEAAALMGEKQIRRIPVLEGGKICGMLTLGDMAKTEMTEAAKILNQITRGISSR